MNENDETTPLEVDANPVTEVPFDGSLMSPTPPEPLVPLGAPVSSIPPTPPAKKSRKPLFIVLAVVLVLLTAAGSYFLLAYLNGDDSAQDTTDTNTSTQTQPETTSDYAQELINKVETALTAEFGATYPAMKITKGEDYGSAMYKAPGANYFVKNDEIGELLSVEPSEAGGSFDQVATDEIGAFINQTIANDTTLTITKTEGTTQRATHYQNENVTCSVLDGESNYRDIVVACANVRDYADFVTEIAPFATAYLASEESLQNQNGNTTAFSKPTINEKSDGYKNAEVPISSLGARYGGVYGLFYTKGDTWSYFDSSQQALSCSKYDTYDIQKAFEGDACYDEATENVEATVVVKE